MEFAQRLRDFQRNVFADMDRAKGEAIARGQHLIDLSLGSSDLPTPEPILAAIRRGLEDPTTHGYLLHQGTRPFRQAVARWYEQRYGIALDPETEVLPLIGSQEGTAHLPLAILNPGDYALLLNPGYPSHMGGVYLAGGRVYTMALRPENQFLPVFADIPADVLAQSRLMVLSYPHNPTTAIAPLAFFREAVAFCQAHDLVLVHDFPYGDMYFPPTPEPPSMLQADPGKHCTIEFLTFSKSYNMGGFRVGFAVGNRELILALRQLKAAIDFNQYRGILDGAIAALASPPLLVRGMVEQFQGRRDALIAELGAIGWTVPTPGATMYVWAELPKTWRGDAVTFCQELVLATGVALSPGSGFGTAGEGYVRFALVQEPAILREAVQRIAGFLGAQERS